MKLLYCIIRDIDPTQVTSGSMVRPLMLRSALEEVAEKVVVIDGGSRNRKQLWQRIDYRSFDAVYCELNTLPIALSDSDHIPRHPFMDIHFLKRIHRDGIPVAAYYRDLHWRYPGMVSSRLNPGTYLLMILHYLELRQLSSCLSHLFVPSMTMFERMPTRMPRSQVSALPPGARIRDRHVADEDHIRLLYVGGVRPPLYDLHTMINAVAKLPEITLTICCREQDWKHARKAYNLSENITVLHRSEKELDSLYQASNALLMYLNPDSENYLKLAMPVKLFEAIGASLPIITNKATEMGELIERNDFGWTFDNVSELRDFLQFLSRNKKILKEKSAVVKKARWDHTWHARAREIIRVLNSYAR